MGAKKVSLHGLKKNKQYNEICNSALTSGWYEKKNTAYFFFISLFVPELFKFLKYAN